MKREEMIELSYALTRYQKQRRQINRVVNEINFDEKDRAMDIVINDLNELITQLEGR